MITNNPKIEIWNNHALISDDTHFTPWTKQHGSIAFHHHISRYRKYIPNGGVVVDGGANQGMYSAAFCELVGDEGSVYSFEPNELPFVCLCINAPKSNRYMMALGEKDGFCDIAPKQNNYSAAHLKNGERVTIRPLDFLGLSKCDLIKLDLEGYELFALKGAKATIKKNKPVLVLEVNPRHMSRFGHKPKQLYEFIESLGYKVVDQWGIEAQLDIICIPK
jgi:FkbM family methyltransferase